MIIGIGVFGFLGILLGMIGVVLILISLIIWESDLLGLGVLLIVFAFGLGFIESITHADDSNTNNDYYEDTIVSIDTAIARPSGLTVFIPNKSLQFNDYTSLYEYVYDTTSTITIRNWIDSDGAISNTDYFFTSDSTHNE